MHESSPSIVGQEVNGEFQAIVDVSYTEEQRQALGEIGVSSFETPFGVDLMTQFTEEHAARARQQADMVTVTTYTVGGNISDR